MLRIPGNYDYPCSYLYFHLSKFTWKIYLDSNHYPWICHCWICGHGILQVRAIVCHTKLISTINNEIHTEWITLKDRPGIVYWHGAVELTTRRLLPRHCLTSSRILPRQWLVTHWLLGAMLDGLVHCELPKSNLKSHRDLIGRIMSFFYYSIWENLPF